LRAGGKNTLKNMLDALTDIYRTSQSPALKSKLMRELKVLITKYEGLEIEKRKRRDQDDNS